MKSWFILNGNQGSGKDAFKQALSKYAKVKSISTVDVPKEIAKSLGWDGVKRDSDRNMLSDLKDWWTKYFDGSFKYVERELNNFLYGERDSDVEIFTVDSREPEEIERFVKTFDFETILVERDSANHAASNHADSNVHEYKDYDYVIYNNGTLEDLDNLAKTFVENIVKGDPNVDCGDVSDVESETEPVMRECFGELQKRGRKLTKVRLVERSIFNSNTEEIVNRELDSLCRDGYYIRDVKFCKSSTHSGFMIIYDTEEK